MVSEKDLSQLKIDKSRVQYKKSFSKKIVTTTVIITLIIVVILFSINFFSGTHTVEATSVTKYFPTQSLTILNASGYVVASRKASAAPKVTGMVVEMRVEEGSKVKKGEIIASLENKDVLALREQAQANLKVAQENINVALAELRDAKINLDRKEMLLKEGFVTQSDYDFALMRFNKAEASLKSAKSNAEAARAALKSAEVSIEYTFIRSPFDGVVLTKNADLGDIVTPFGSASGLKAAVATIADMNSLQVEADVSESNLLKISIGQPCEIILDALLDKRLSGIVHTIVPTADKTKASVMVKVSFLEKDASILPEMSAKVAFLSKKPSENDRIPITAVNKNAIFERDGKKSLFVISEGKISQRAIKTGRVFTDMIEIIEGVKA
ncbi:MAG: efflux RND transporter periplasmic adaptor subunit, partial [Thermodesulfovibrionales bacterium]|nr:efflux RND transporter periplasmic adaptor subunit [Thermodesulfovibrionales bacterium]